MKQDKDTAAVILAAGAGTRMKSGISKVLHEVCGEAMLGHVLNTVQELGSRLQVVVVGHGRKEVQAYIEKRSDKRVEVVTQWPPRGTGHALLQTPNKIGSRCGSILVLCGDAPLVRKTSLQALIRARQKAKAACSILTFRLDNPTGYGRIVRDTRGRPERIVEELNATAKEKQVTEVNSGIYCFERKALFDALRQVKPDKIKKEIYLTDVIEILAKAAGVVTVETDDPSETLGVNTRKDLSVVTQIRKKAILDRLMLSGVTIVDPVTTFVGEKVKIGRDTVVHPNTVIDGPARIGSKCSIGPFARIRSGVTLGNGVTVGNFVEVVRSKVGDRTTVKHLTYLGDTVVGSDTNIGCGTITANFDGRNKHMTKIGRKVKIGSGTILVAPIKVGDAAVTAAGAVVPSGKDIQKGSTVAGVPAKPMKKPRKKRR